MKKLQVKTSDMFYLVLLVCDTIAAVLLFFVENKGSWLEIGTSLSRFIIMEVIVLFILLLFYMVEFLIGPVSPEDVYSKKWIPNTIPVIISSEERITRRKNVPFRIKGPMAHNKDSQSIGETVFDSSTGSLKFCPLPF